MIHIVDYGMGNLRSVQKAFEKLGVEATICTQPAELAHAEKLVLPGVGAFRDAIDQLRRQELVGPVLDHIQADKPFLGICLGLQLLFDVSYEDGEWEGLGVVPGTAVRFQNQPDLKIPHMGWNQLEIVRPNRLLEGIAIGPSGRLAGVERSEPQARRTRKNAGGSAALQPQPPKDAWFYFVHSYYVVPADESVIAAYTEHGTRFVSMIARGNLFATQFHPEKSQCVGLKLLQNFAAL